MTRHPVLDPDLDVIGALPLCDRPNFILWKFDRGRNGKPTKIPKTLDGKTAAWGNRKTRAPFVHVAAAYRVRYTPGSHLWGIGFVFDDDQYVSLDLDDCRNAVTGQLSDFAREMLAAFPTYAEVSPSGVGLHIIGSCRGPKPPNFKNRRAGIELIATTFLTLTGVRPTADALPITDCTDALSVVTQRYNRHTRPSTDGHSADRTIIGDDIQGVTERPPSLTPGDAGTEGIGPDDLLRPVTDITDADLRDRARAAANGAKFSALWDGDCSGFASQSEADLALCCMLAFWTQGNPDRIDALFRQSKLKREKWNRPDYRKRTIARAIAYTTHVYEPPIDIPDSAPPDGVMPGPDVNVTAADLDRDWTGSF